ncbi:MAG: nitrous oxide reductase family maturation protein NosD [Promethearchaeota archaeon]
MKNKNFVLTFLLLISFYTGEFTLTIHSNVSSVEITQRIASIHYTPLSPIWITNDNDLNDSFPGMGTIVDPIRIEGYNITAASGALIYISDTTFYFRITDCLLNGLSAASQGIHFQNVGNSTIRNNTISYCGKGIELNSSSNISITNNTLFSNVFYNTYGIDMNYTSNISVTNNSIYDTGHDAIRLWNSDFNTFTSNTIYNNNASGFSINTATNIKVLSNTIYDNEFGMHTCLFDDSLIAGNLVYGHLEQGMRFWSCENNTLSDNTFFNQDFEGVGLYYSEEFMISNNTLFNNSRGKINPWEGSAISLDDSSNNTLINNRVYDNNRSGIAVSHTGEGGNTLVNNTVYNNDGSGIRFIDADNNTLINNSVYYNSGTGIEAVYNSDNNTLINNTVYNNGDDGIAVGLESSFASIINNTIYNNVGNGIFIWDELSRMSDNNSIKDNTIYGNNWDGISIWCSSNNTIVNNTISNNQEYSIRLTESGNNIVIDNNFINNGFWILGYQIKDYIQTKITNNNVNGRPVIYWQDVHGATVPSDVGQIILVNCHSIDIIDHNLPYASNGIITAYCTDLFISNNTLSEGVIGIFLHNSSATIINNTIYNCFFLGIDLHYYCYNSLIMNNTVYNCDGPICLYMYSENNYISHNTIYDGSIYGVGLWGYCKNNVIHSNHLSNNDHGITINDASDSNQIMNNTIQNSHNYGISLDFWGTIASNNNIISSNTILNNAGYGISIMNESSQANRVELNVISGNNPGGSQAADDGSTNVFAYNYWSDWTSPDTNKDGIVDHPYSIDGMANNQDNYPLVVSPTNHYVLLPIITSPLGGEILSGKITISWATSVDTWGYDVKYDVSYSTDGGTTWTLLGTDLTGTSFVWDTKTVPDGSNYILKIEASSSGEMNAVFVSSSPFTISNYPTIPPTTTITSTTSTIETTTSETNPTETPVATSSWHVLLMLLSLFAMLSLKKRK